MIPPPPTDHRGFSLLELVVVLAILGTIMTIAVPRFAAAVDRYRADATPLRLAADLERAVAEARARRRDVTLVFDVGGNEVRSFDLAGLRGAPETYHFDLASEPYRSSLIDVDFEGASTLTFDGFGTPNRTGTITIRSGRIQRVLTVGADGHVHIGDPITVPAEDAP